MVIGDPYKFSILFDRVKSWNASLNDNNGFFGLSIYGKMFPDTVINAIIPVSLFELKNSLSNIPVNEEIYNLSSNDAFKALYNLVYPQNYDYNDYRYELATADLTHIFDESALLEVILDKSEVNKIIREIEKTINDEYMICC